MDRPRDDPINTPELRDAPVVAMEDAVAAMSAVRCMTFRVKLLCNANSLLHVQRYATLHLR